MHDEAIVYHLLTLFRTRVLEEEGYDILSASFVRECVEVVFRYGHESARRESLFKALCMSLGVTS